MKDKIFAYPFRVSIFSAILCFYYSTQLLASEWETVNFPSSDSLEITADLYLLHPLQAPFIILFHQAGWSRGEYREIAPRLNQLGFNCMAVDQRSGDEVNGVRNETHRRAIELGKSVEYLDAEPDILAAVHYVRKKFPRSKLIIWGSSYSSSLVLKFAGEHPGVLDGVLSFSPGEYFERFGASPTLIRDAAKHINCPVFITSAKKEADNWRKIFDALPIADKFFFIPKSQGNHGSRALWKKFADHAAYWQALESFLNRLK